MAGGLQDISIRNLVVTGTLRLPDAVIGDRHIEAGAAIAASKLVHRHAVVYQQPATTIVSVVTPVLIARGTSGTIVGLEAAILVAAAGAATVTVDLQKSTGGGAFASVLDDPIDIDSTTTIRTVLAGAVSSASFVDGDIFELVVIATAGGGTLPQGLVVTLTVDEAAS